MCTAHTSYRLSYSLAQTLGVITLRGPNELLHVDARHDGVVEQVVNKENCNYCVQQLYKENKVQMYF